MQRMFSERERGPRARTGEAIPRRVWGALYDLVHAKVDDGSLGYRFPAMCPDGAGPCGTNHRAFWRTAQAEIPDLPQDLNPGERPEPVVILDLLKFCAWSIAHPIQGGFHSFFCHHHLDFERKSGLADFVSSVNRLFARNGIAFELTAEGHAERFGPTGLREECGRQFFTRATPRPTGFLEDARRRILSPHVGDR